MEILLELDLEPFAYVRELKNSLLVFSNICVQIEVQFYENIPPCVVATIVLISVPIVLNRLVDEAYFPFGDRKDGFFPVLEVILYAFQRSKIGGVRFLTSVEEREGHVLIPVANDVGLEKALRKDGSGGHPAISWMGIRSGVLFSRNRLVFCHKRAEAFEFADSLPRRVQVMCIFK